MVQGLHPLFLPQSSVQSQDTNDSLISADECTQMMNFGWITLFGSCKDISVNHR